MHSYITSRLYFGLLLLVITGVSGFIFFDSAESDKSSQKIDLAIVDNLLHSMEQSTSYQLIPESIMTGFCWRADDGSREGVFKDVNAGLAQWRDRQPEISGNNASAIAVNAANNYADLSNELQALSFEATEYSFQEEKAEVTGILTIANRKREVVLDMDLPDPGKEQNKQSLVAIKAVAEVNLDDFNDSLPDSSAAPVNLCIMMQLARNFDNRTPSSGKHLQLSHFY
jgi:hypothetical protein